MEYINRLHYLASELLSGMKVDSVIDWKLELALTRKRAQQSVQRIAFGAFTVGVLVSVVVALIVVFFIIGVR